MPSDSTLKPGPGAHSPEKVSFFFIISKEINVFSQRDDLHVQLKYALINIFMISSVTEFISHHFILALDSAP
jgi:hypothetical protein